jgi:hypothetical protein
MPVTARNAKNESLVSHLSHPACGCEKQGGLEVTNTALQLYQALPVQQQNRL